MGNKSPLTLGGTAVKLCLMVKNTDDAVERASAAGAWIRLAHAAAAHLAALDSLCGAVRAACRNNCELSGAAAAGCVSVVIDTPASSPPA